MSRLQSVLENAEWFRRSGVMVPASGEWGVAERVAVMENNEATEEIYRGFPAYTPHAGYAILESRRADCNFETALMFFLMHEFTGCEADRATAKNIMDFLYYRSGLLNRAEKKHTFGVWNWSHIWKGWYLWIDDNSWSLFIEILLGGRYPELDKEYGCTEWGVKLAKELLKVFRRTFTPGMENKDVSDPEKEYSGLINHPHFGALLMMAFLAADRVAPDPAYRAAVKEYFEFIVLRFDTFNASELSYVLIAAPLIASVYGDDPLYGKVMERTAGALRKRIAKNPYSNLPAEHTEAPCGEHLVDTIYTVNWAFLGFVNLAGVTKKAEDEKTANDLANLLMEIQDPSVRPHLHGCWRGMYDMTMHAWGGGDKSEGGANSIYTGWTNAPISIGLMLLERGESMLSLFH